jgi:hypothetical protein
MCSQLKRLVKSHIIPRRFFELIRGSGNYSVLVNADKPLKEAGTFLQAGPYDDSMLCQDCERKFSDFDNYGWQILGEPLLNEGVYDNGVLYAYKIACDTDKVRRFLLSVLWRASVSSLACYSRVNLGSRGDTIKSRIFDPTPLTGNEFPITAMRLPMEALGKYKDMLFQPLRERIYGLISHILYLPPNLKFVIATGRGNFPTVFRKFLITDPNFLYLLDHPEELMVERKFVPAMIEKMRGANQKPNK